MCDDYVVRLRGLPWSAARNDIIKFLDDCTVIQVEFHEQGGRPSGEAFVVLSSKEDVNKALDKNQQYMGRRYIEVFESSDNEMKFKLSSSGASGYDDNEDAVVHLRGLPFEATRNMLLDFFDGFPVTPNGVSILMDNYGRATGEAFVQFATQELADKALHKHKERMGHRYIEVFKSSLHEARTSISMANRASFNNMRPGPYDRPPRNMGYRGGSRMKGYDYTADYDEDYFPRMGRGGPRRGGPGRSYNENYVSQTNHFLHMRGLPFNATVDEIREFFRPIIPSNIQLCYGMDGRPSGEADVDFENKTDVLDAMKRDRGRMQHRYVELFLGKAERGHGDNYKAF